MRFIPTFAAVLALGITVLADNVDNCKNSCSYGNNGCDSEGACAINCIACTNQGLGVPQDVCGCKTEPDTCDTACRDDCYGHCNAFAGTVYDIGVAVCQIQCGSTCGC